MSLEIKSINAELVDLGLTKPYTIAYKTIDSVEILFVKVEAKTGMSGLGASNTKDMLIGGGNSEALNELSGAALEKFAGRDLGNFDGRLDDIHREFQSIGARTALDIAFHDLYTKHLGMSLASFYGQKHKSLLTSVTIGIMGIEETIEEARQFIGEGFKIIKVKLGTRVEEDIERIEALKAALPKEIKIRIDANQGWSGEDTIKFYQKTEHLDIELIEQPLPVSMADEMRAFPGNLKRMIAADESLYSPADASQLAQDPIAAGIFNIKLMKCAGVSKAREISHIAENAGIDLMWGCNDESAISISAALHTALSCRRTRYLDLDGSFDLVRDIVKDGFILNDGALSIIDKPGLGVEILS